MYQCTAPVLELDLTIRTSQCTLDLDLDAAVIEEKREGGREGAGDNIRGSNRKIRTHRLYLFIRNWSKTNPEIQIEIKQNKKLEQDKIRKWNKTIKKTGSRQIKKLERNKIRNWNKTKKKKRKKLEQDEI